MKLFSMKCVIRPQSATGVQAHCEARLAGGDGGSWWVKLPVTDSVLAGKSSGQLALC